jgi:LmbE family N-acetylglucosaminyl deacetylase
MDEVLGCGGTIARLAAEGVRVETLVLFGDGTGLDMARRPAGAAAAGILGGAAPRYAGFAENRGDTIPLLDVVAAVERTISEIRPSEMYLPHGGNLNIDHQVTYRAAVTAARPVPGLSIAAIYAYEVLSSTDWAPPSTSPFQPNRFVDISATLEKKLAALQFYAAEMRAAPHSRSYEGISNLARTRGFSVGLAAAEAFMVPRQIVR